jgi:hypothetical protein
LLGASGGVELVLSVLAMRDNLMPPTINLDSPDEGVRPRLHAEQSQGKEGRHHYVEQLWFRRTQRVADRGPAQVIDCSLFVAKSAETSSAAK